MSKKNEVYQNAPLVEAIFEIRFPVEPAIECNRDKFYEKIRKIYPKVLVPKSFKGRAAALEPYKFEREDNTSGVMLSINNLAVYTRKYEKFALFQKETMEMLSIFQGLFKIQNLDRIGLRYINIIPLTRENNIIPIQSYLNIHVSLPKSIPTDFKSLNIIFVSQTKVGTITTRIEPVISQDQTKEVFILDFDYAKKDNLKFDLIEKYLNESHNHTKYLFEELITEEYKKVMRGEVI